MYLMLQWALALAVPTLQRLHFSDLISPFTERGKHRGCGQEKAFLNAFWHLYLTFLDNLLAVLQ
jgi:hypothetical protein